MKPLKPLTDIELAFVDWLKTFHSGRGNAIHAKLMSQWGNRREIRYMVHNLRLHGHPICSGQYGYYYAETSDEIVTTLNFLEGIVNETQRALEGIRDTYYEMKHSEITTRE